MKYAGLHLLLASVAHAETSIIYQAWGNPAQGQTSNEIARAFAKADPGIKVDIQLADGDCYWEKLRVLVAGSTPPDVVAMDALLYPDWQSRGVLLNLQPYLDGDPIIPDGYFGCRAIFRPSRSHGPRPHASTVHPFRLSFSPSACRCPNLPLPHLPSLPSLSRGTIFFLH